MRNMRLKAALGMAGVLAMTAACCVVGPALAADSASTADEIVRGGEPDGDVQYPGKEYIVENYDKWDKIAVLLCNGLVLLKTYLLTVIMLAHRPRVSMSPYLFHPLAIVAVVTSKPLATTHAELNNNCKLKLQIHPTRLFYKTHCLDDQQSHQALTLNSFPANLRDCLRQLSIMRNQQ